jgi:hypothetical protein
VRRNIYHPYMETQQGTRAGLVDPFGRELEEWLRDTPAVRTPYESELVVPPVTGPIQRPTDAPEPIEAVVVEESATEGAAFRRERGRHATSCEPSFPEPPARLALSFGDLAIEVSTESGRSTLERIEFLEGQLDVRDADLARLAAWETVIAESDDPEADAARSYAREVFADIIADAAAERAIANRAMRLREATAERESSLQIDAEPADELAAPPASPMSATTRPTPLVQPATGPNVFDHEAFVTAVRTHSGHTGEQPRVFPLAPVDAAEPSEVATADAERPGWWTRFVAGVLRLVGRR